MTANKTTQSPGKTRSSPAKSTVMLGSSSAVAAATTHPNTVKLVSWNVAGLAACVKKGLLKYLKAEDADVVCLQETKLNQTPAASALPKSMYPYQYWHHCTKRKGYSGTVVASKIKPISTRFGLRPASDAAAVVEGADELEGEGRVITLEFSGCYVVACYSPNAGEGLKRLAYKRTYARALTAHIEALSCAAYGGKPVICCGDLNVAHQAIDLARPKTNTKSAGFTAEEREDFDRMLTSQGLVDTFRARYPEVEGKYSYYSYRFQCRSKGIGWRVDYFLAAKEIMEDVVAAEIRDDMDGGASDHIPILLELSHREKYFGDLGVAVDGKA